MNTLIGLALITWTGALAPVLLAAVLYLVDRVILEGTRT
jgi:hypothetical protein